MVEILRKRARFYAIFTLVMLVSISLGTLFSMNAQSYGIAVWKERKEAALQAGRIDEVHEADEMIEQYTRVCTLNLFNIGINLALILSFTASLAGLSRTAIERLAREKNLPLT